MSPENEIRLVRAVEEISVALHSLDSKLDRLIHTAEDGGAYISVEMLDSEDEGDDE